MFINNLSLDNKSLFLGSAMWGWTVSKQNAFCLLDHYAESGHKLLDHATNYPINGSRKDFGLGLKWLAEWLKSNPNSGLEILVKIGSTNNLGTPETDLSVSSIQRQYNRLLELLGDSLKCVAIHWDNRESAEGRESILNTLNALHRLSNNHGCRIGLSGIKSPNLYAKFFESNHIKPIIQVKENVLTSSARTSYEKHFAQADYVAYGINLGGLRENSESETLLKRGIEHPGWVSQSFKNVLEDSDLEPSPKNFYDISLYFSYINPYLSGMIIGPKNKEQLKKILVFFEDLKNSKKLSNYKNFRDMITLNGISK